MNDQNFDINSLRIASPCSVGWENMTGDERRRHCELCSLNVYNISELTKSEVERLIQTREGRLCIRMYRRADGTVLTRDCPVGLRAVRKRVAGFAGATLAAVLGLFTVSFGQKFDKDSIDASKTKMVITKHQGLESELTGRIIDVNGALVPGVEIRLYKKDVKFPIIMKANDEGVYLFKALQPGIYNIEVLKAFGFKAKKITGIKVNENESYSLDVQLVISGDTILLGVVGEESPIDMTSTSVTTTISGRMLDLIPR